MNKQGESLGYYATMSIDISEIDPEKHKAMDVYFRIVRKSDGAEIFHKLYLQKDMAKIFNYQKKY